jgi:hypothetical protein
MLRHISTFCDFEDCTLDAEERRGTQRFCSAHAAEEAARDSDVALLCSFCPGDAEYSHGAERFCRACADAAATQGPAPRRPAPALELPNSNLCRVCGYLAGHAPNCMYAGLGAACDFDDCTHEAGERREELRLCREHAIAHDALQARTLAEQRALRERQFEMLTRHLEAAQAAMVAWFVDARWVIFLEVRISKGCPAGLGLSLERTPATITSVELHADSDVRELALELVLIAEELS